MRCYHYHRHPIMNRLTLVFEANLLSKLFLDLIPFVAVSNGTTTPWSCGVNGEGGIYIISAAHPKGSIGATIASNVGTRQSWLFGSVQCNIIVGKSQQSGNARPESWPNFLIEIPVLKDATLSWLGWAWNEHYFHLPHVYLLLTSCFIRRRWNHCICYCRSFVVWAVYTILVTSPFHRKTPLSLANNIRPPAPIMTYSLSLIFLLALLLSLRGCVLSKGVGQLHFICCPGRIALLGGLLRVVRTRKIPPWYALVAAVPISTLSLSVYYCCSCCIPPSP